MKKEQIQLSVIGVGLVLMAFFLVKNLNPPAKRQAAADAPAAAAAPVDAVVLPAPVNSRVRDKISALQLKRAESAWGRDPFWSVSDSTGKLNELELKGISFSNNKKGYAFINDQIVSAGDTLAGYAVTRIEKDRVMLTRGAQTFFLTFSDK